MADERRVGWRELRSYARYARRAAWSDARALVGGHVKHELCAVVSGLVVGSVVAALSADVDWEWAVAIGGLGGVALLAVFYVVAAAVRSPARIRRDDVRKHEATVDHLNAKHDETVARLTAENARLLTTNESLADALRSREVEAQAVLDRVDPIVQGPRGPGSYVLVSVYRQGGEVVDLERLRTECQHKVKSLLDEAGSSGLVVKHADDWRWTDRWRLLVTDAERDIEQRRLDHIVRLLRTTSIDVDVLADGTGAVPAFDLVQVLAPAYEGGVSLHRVKGILADGGITPHMGQPSAAQLARLLLRLGLVDRFPVPLGGDLPGWNDEGHRWNAEGKAFFDALRAGEIPAS